MLLGASNLTLGFGIVTRMIRNGFASPVEVVAAIGHGRSYGTWSTVAVRSLPGIVNCRLWESLRSKPPVPTYALLTDIGNDLMYGYSPQQIANWVETCFERLSEVEATSIVTRLPIARVKLLSAWRYHATRLSFFPLHKPVSWKEMLRRACELDDRLFEVAKRREAMIIEPPQEWYSVDPIHIRWTQRRRAWQEILSKWPDFQIPTGSVTRPGLSLLGHFPSQYRLIGRECHGAQPTVRREDISLFLY